MSQIPRSTFPRYLGSGILPGLALLLSISLVLAGCGAGTQPEPTPTAPPSPTEATGVPTATVAGSTGGTGGIDSAQSLVDALTKAGMTINSTGPIEQPFFSEKGTSYEAGKGFLQVFEYADQAAADSDAAKVKPDGTIEAYSINWVASPHFYKMGRLIVIYLGDDTTDLGTLKTVLGDPFATAQAPRLP
jgi:hypothetical protein